MKKMLVLAICLLSILACDKRPAPAPAATAPAILPEFEPLYGLYGQFLEFRNDRLYLRHGFTANFPQSDWLQQVRALGEDPDLADRARLLASLAIASRIHGEGSRITRGFEERFTASLQARGPLPPEMDEAPADDAGLDARTPGAPVARAENATDEARAETPRAGGTAAPQGPDHPQHVESSPSAQEALALQLTAAPSAQAGAGRAVEIPSPSMPTHTQPPPSEPAQAPATAAAAPSATSSEPGPFSAALPAPRPDEDRAPAPGVDEETAPGRPETAAEFTPVQKAASPHAPAALLPEQTPRSGLPANITVLFTGDTQGVVYPQPGLAGTVGGIARRLPAIARVRDESPTLVLLDAGDALVSGGPRAERINKTLVRAMNRMRYDAMGLGPLDAAVGEMALRELASIASFPFVCSNLEFRNEAQAWIEPYVLIERGRRTIAVISLLKPDTELKITGARIIDPKQAMDSMMAQLGPRADAFVLLTQMGREEIRSLLGAAQNLDVILGDARSASQDSPRYVPAVAKGMGMGLVELNKLDGVVRSGRAIPLVTSGIEDPNLLRMLEEMKY